MQGLVEQGMYKEQENSLLEWLDHTANQEESPYQNFTTLRILIFDFQPPELREIKFLFFFFLIHPVYGTLLWQLKQTNTHGLEKAESFKESTCNAGIPIQFLGQEDPLEKG